ncbi:MAG: polymer-forming cytoskeletal protein, partial [Deltaproteobacteria bacterium]|nr:polymer-forming cytoskeletal protein [Deltaproteobacteria bacterium]
VRAIHELPQLKEDQTMDKKTEIGGGPMNTLLGKGSSFNGTLKVEGGIRIDGQVEGQVETSGTLVIGKEGILKAEIKAKDAIIGGKVTGNITAANKIELQSGAHFSGDIKCRGLIIDSDVFFDGTSKMLGQNEGKS